MHLKIYKLKYANDLKWSKFRESYVRKRIQAQQALQILWQFKRVLETFDSF